MLTFLFTDIEGSTKLWSRYPAAMEDLLARHDQLLEKLITRHGGEVIKHMGDGLFAVFEGGEPLTCALEIQRRLAAEDWGEIGELRVRIALHTGAAGRREADYFGLEVSRTARLLSAAWGGQILLTCELARAATLPPGADLHDLGNHLLKDLSHPQHIYQLRHPDLPLRKFPPPRTLSAHPHNLPPQPTPFVGREEELRDIAARLADPACRLLTLVGPGGIGKTRLALQAAAAEIETFDHGVYFVPLAALNSDEFLVSAIAEALHFSFYQRDVPRAQLLSYLREKHMLLVLDNFEHIIAGAPLASELLASASQIKVLVTSRERLNVRGEMILPVAGMPFPSEFEIEADAAMPDIEMYAAVQLFLQYARRVQPAFAFDAEDRACVARICEQVLGMPLALELAASWLRMLSCQEIAEELASSPDFLSSTLRDTPERHRSLRAVFEYSWQLLSEAEQRAVQALAVFQGTFQREAAFAVLRDPAAPARSVALLRVLAALVDKSLVQHHADGEYVMHALLREYAREKLRSAPALETQIRQRHSAHYANFLQQRRADLNGAEQRAALDAISHVLEDVRVAWQWAAQQQQVNLLARGMHSLARFFGLSGRRQEGAPLFAMAIEALEPLATPEAETVRGWLLAFAANLTAYMEDDRAHSLASSALMLAHRLDIAPVKARALGAQGRLAWLRGEYESARHHYREALEIYTAAEDLSGQAKILDSLGATAWIEGHYDEARAYFERSQALFQQIGNPSGIASALDHLGVVARDTGDLATARVCFEQSYRCLRDLDARVSLAYAANHLGGVLAMMGSLADAQPYFEQCIAIGEELGERRIVAYTRHDWGQMLYQRGHLQDAWAMLVESEVLFEVLGDQFGLILTRIGLGDITRQQGNLATAQDYYSAAVRGAAALQNLRLIAHALIGWASYLEAAGRLEAAAETLGYAQALPHDLQETGNREAALLAQLKAQLPGDVLAVALARGEAADLSDIFPIASSDV